MGHACAICDRFNNIKTLDIWCDEHGNLEEQPIKFYAGMVIHFMPHIGNEWYELMAKRIKAQKRKTITDYLKENPAHLHPKKAANWIIRNWHIVSSRRINEPKESYLSRCIESITINIERPDDENPVSQRVRKAYDLISAGDTI